MRCVLRSDVIDYTMCFAHGIWQLMRTSARIMSTLYHTPLVIESFLGGMVSGIKWEPGVCARLPILSFFKFYNSRVYYDRAGIEDFDSP